MVERRPLTTTADKVSSTNGSGAAAEVTLASPLPTRLRELERRISAALTGERTAHDLANLLMQCDLAVPQAEEFAKLENEKSLDPLQSPDPREARQAAEDAVFAANRLRTLRPRLLARYHEVSAAEMREQYLGRYTDLKREGAVLAQELVDHYPALVGPLVEVFGRLRDFQQRCRALHLTDTQGGLPHVIDPELAARGLRAFSADTPSLLESVHLHDWHSGKEVWPPRQPSFAADFAQSMTIPSVGAAWADPAVQERRRDELVAAQEKMARHHAAQAAEQEERQNRQLREDWEARRNGRG